MTMNPEVKQLWIGALRSGDYKQSTGALRRPDVEACNVPDGFCCLGVLTDLYIKEHPNEARWALNESNSTMRVEFTDPDREGYNTAFFLPDAVSDWAGLGTSDPLISTDQHGTLGLAACNDERKWSFEMIAEIIEEQL